jgi:transcriptional regulator with XRE-family HTH domain
MTATLLATLLRNHRRETRMTQQELGVKSGVSVRAISDMERGFSRAPQRRTIDALAKALGLGVADRDALAAAARAVRGATSGVCALPRDLPDFTGRRAELARLAAACRPDTVTVVHGPPGVGKTALAVHAATRFAGRVRFVDCRGSSAGPASLDEVTDRLNRAGQDWDLLVLDDVADRSVAPPPAGRAILITARRPLPAAEPLRLTPLPADDSVRLLTAITGLPECPHARAVADRCGHLPLALRAAGNRLVTRPGWTMADLAGRLAPADRRLAVLTTGDLSVQQRFSSAYATLDPAARRALRLLAEPGMATLAELGLLSELAHLYARTLPPESVTRT